MGTKTLLTKAMFAKHGEAYAEVALPHTWNAFDGQDGGNDYWRGVGTYDIELPNPTEGKKAWLAQRDSFAQSFVGKTVEEVNAIVVECDDKSQPKTITGVEYVTGATQSSGRTILAIQNALSKLAK